MKYSIIACAVTGALALNTNLVAPRDADTVISILGDVKKNLEALDSSVKSYSGDQAPLLKASKDVVSALTDGKTKVEGSDELDLNGAIKLTGPVQDLTKSGEALTSGLKEFRPTVEKESACTIFRTQVGSVNDASQALIKAVIAKVPEEAQSIASQLVAGLTKVLQEAVDVFSESNCKDSGNAGASSTGSAPASSSAAATSSAAAGSSSAAAGSSSAAPTGAASSSATSAPYPTSSAVSTGTGAASSSGAASSDLPVVTAGAAAIAPLGAAAIAAAAMLL
ncbi:cell wall galactomannoprotein Mp2/allergen F17-like protein [Beauveria brongniartii RCEF 3172]|uniref:Cell wall galactomannoprotein Mp2/allergen F17-like protein n=1 Tax=Beauveria brongniartii RCEF 3172 TaxID=1081107 RepID=A0A162KGK1_9HYPO|nr:cell wall galactomannoprotein Mp2/allergen F17-like protein [Beauveria brongniartii RCEF 3172]